MRRRLVKTVLWGGLIVVAAVVLGLAFVGRESYSQFAETSLRSAAEARGLGLTTRRFEIFPFGARASELELFIRRAWLHLRFGPSEARLKILPLRSEFQLAAYGGTITGTLRPEIFGDTITGEIVATGLKLAEHAQLSSIGITGGALNLEVAPLTSGAQGLEQASFTLTIADGAKPERLTVRPGQFGSPFGFSIPPIAHLSARVHGALEGSQVVLQEIALASSLGSFSGTARIPRNSRGDLSVDGLLTLTPEGIKELGPYLMIATGGNLPSDGGKLRLFLRGPIGSPRLRITRAG